MLKKLHEYIPITTAIVLFLYISGGFYLLAYWGTFGVDISNLVGITEIPKSFFVPFSLAVGLAIFNLFLGVYVFKAIGIKSGLRRYYRWVIKNYASICVGINLSIYLSFSLISVLSVTQLFRHSEIFWSLSSISFSIFLSLRIYLSKRIRSKIRKIEGARFLIFVSVFTLILSLGVGFTESAKIYKNRVIQEIRPITDSIKMRILPMNDSISFKFLGFLGDKFIISSLDNKRVIILNQSDFEGMELVKKVNGK